MEGSKRSKLTGEALEQMKQGVSLMFSQWKALGDAVDHGWGGLYSREKEASLFASVISFFSHSKSNEPLYIDDLEGLLDDGLLSLGVENIDRELEEVATKLMIMHEECLEGNYQSVQRLMRKVTAIPHVVKAGNGDSIPDDNDHMGDGDDIETSTGMIIDSPAAKDMEADGWVTVSRKKSKGRKKVGKSSTLVV